MSLAPGAQLGAYRIIAILGSGGMGEVYRAHDARLGRDVALKILPDATAKDPDGLARFEREARAVAALNHPHIVTIYTTEEDAGIRFLTMELVEGRTLDQIIPARGMPLTQFFDIAAALADALSAAHQKHIIHRDLKPSNVMVTDDGRVKVLDFGLASANEQPGPDLTDDVTRPALTKAGTILGTVPYMSPEQIEARPIDPRSDLFSLGVVMHEMATGARPFRGDSSPSVMASILRDHPRPVSELRPDMPEGVSRLVARCLEKAARDRVQSANDVLAELRALRRSWESGVMSGPAPGSASRPAKRAASIAVLPFTDMSAARDQDWFCDGIAEEILNALTPLQDLRVAARTSAFSFKGKSADLREIGDKLNVTTVLEGSVRRAGDRVRITVQLSDVQNGYQLWSERYDRELKDIFDVQDEIAKAIAERLKVTLAGVTADRLVEHATTNMEAYQIYLKGLSFLARRGPGIPLALEQFQKAVALDPDYALAWSGIADVYTMFAYYGHGDPDQARPRALEAANRAVELDPRSAEAHTSLACALLLYQGDPAGAEREFLKALELNPHYVQGRTWYALLFVMWTRGLPEDALAEARRALADDPLSSYAMTIVAFCMGSAGRGEEAIAMARRAVETDPQAFLANWTLGQCLLWEGKADQSVAVHKRLCEVSGHTSIGVATLAAATAQSSHPEEALALYELLAERAKSKYVSLAQIAITAAAAGKRDEALLLAKRAWDHHEPYFLAVARHHLDYQWFRLQPEFAEILREMDA
ncbi:MAG: protein kinase [Acidobacteriota bacterium]|nr:protein kinase [Acidobacteriota bacterium]